MKKPIEPSVAVVASLTLFWLVSTGVAGAAFGGIVGSVFFAWGGLTLAFLFG